MKGKEEGKEEEGKDGVMGLLKGVKSMARKVLSPPLLCRLR